MCFRYLWNYLLNWASGNPDITHSQSEKLAGGEFYICSHKVLHETISLPILRLSQYCDAFICLLVYHHPPQVFSNLFFYVPPFRWVFGPPPDHSSIQRVISIDLCSSSSLSEVTMDTGPPSVCQVSRMATRCDLLASIWIWRVPQEQPQPAQTTCDRKRQRK